MAAQLALSTICGMYDLGPVPDWSVGTFIVSAKCRMALTVQYWGCVYAILGFYFCASVHHSISQMKHQLDAFLCRFYFCRVTLQK